ncbi:rubredoxin [Persicobacter psychrovividus]|uniref:Rubredoxin-like domain-containing protein n=1 Tax=Persicobacter psychrovividus TaxID=387638 RepID=A0ABN6LG19_9BACT|nr:hypothetical protein PEPS_29530 [Persicobacter psychrovividus]
MDNYKAKKQGLVRIFTTGGMLAPSALHRLIQKLKYFGLSYFHFGSRQDILFPMPEEFSLTEIEEELQDLHLPFEIDTHKKHNVVSTFVTEGYLSSTPWVHADTYQFIFDDITSSPHLKVNLVDPKQQLVPWFSGNLNFLAAESENDWHLFLRNPQDDRLIEFPYLIDGFAIAEVVEILDQDFLQRQQWTDTDPLLELIKSHKLFTDRPSNFKNKKEKGPIPQYEGFQRMGDGKYWLGLYWRNNAYTLDFMEALCELCANTGVGKIGITPFKSFIVQGIPEKHYTAWFRLLGKFGINPTHSSLELNWHVPVLDQRAQDLKRYLVKVFDQNDININGLTFTIATVPVDPFTSIWIQQNPEKNEQITTPPTYHVYITKGFDPANLSYHLHEASVLKEDLPEILFRLSKQYFDQWEAPATDQPKVKENSPMGKTIHQCSSCFSVYDPTYGDIISQPPVAPGLPFSELPESYACGLCGAPKADFEAISSASLYQ